MVLDKSEYLKYKIDRAYETISEANDAINTNHLHLACNRIYYSIFYIVTALALKYEYSTSKHMQLLGWFNKTFIKEQILPLTIGETYMRAYKNRQEGDYGDMVIFELEEVRKLYNEMIIFVKEVEKLIHL